MSEPCPDRSRLPILQPPSRQELHEYLDGRLPAARAAEVASWLSQHPDKAAAVEAWRAQIAGLHALYDDVLGERLSPGLAALVAVMREEDDWTSAEDAA